GYIVSLTHAPQGYPSQATRHAVAEYAYAQPPLRAVLYVRTPARWATRGTARTDFLIAFLRRFVTSLLSWILSFCGRGLHLRNRHGRSQRRRLRNLRDGHGGLPPRPPHHRFFPNYHCVPR